MPQVRRIEILPRQAEVLACHPGRLAKPEPVIGEILISGAKGAAKTWALIWKILDHAAIPGNHVGLARLKRVDLERSTLQYLLNGDDNMPPGLPSGSYMHDKRLGRIAINGGGTIEYLGCDTFAGSERGSWTERLGGYNWGACGIDEVTEIEFEHWAALKGRLRNRVDKSKELIGACNPKFPSHWLYKRFYQMTGAEKRECGRALIHCSLEDNWFLPAEFVTSQRALQHEDPQAYARDVLGQWVAFEGLIYRIDPELHYRKEKMRQWARVIAGVDEGYDHPAVVAVVGIGEGERARLVDELHQTRLTHEDIIRECERLGRRWEIDTFFVDPSAIQLCAGLRRAGLHAMTTRELGKGRLNDVKAGIGCIRNRLLPGPDGLPRLTLDRDRCPRICGELESYHVRPESDEPAKVADDGPDALRYAIWGIDGTARVGLAVSGAGGRTEGMSKDKIAAEQQRYLESEGGWAET